MFSKKKNHEKLLNALEDKFRILDNKFDSLEQNIITENENLKEINQQISTLTSSVHKHDMAIEDLLDEWEEKRSDECSTQKLLKESGQNEQQLLELFEAYQEQFWNLKRFADTKDEAWAAQMTLMEKKLEHCRQLCGISIIGESGIEVDYNLHEVIEAVDTSNPGQDKIIADVYHCGYIYKGRVQKKAAVSAYRTVTY